MTNRLLLIETSTALCSVALVENGKVVASKESTVPRSHASQTAPFVQELLAHRDLEVRDCDAVCVSKGPGSYTGLRVGVSTAKGLCFGAGIPLLAVGTLDTLVWQAIHGKLLPEGCRHVIPMIDARRMEVYTGIFTPDGRQVSPTAACIIDRDTFSRRLDEGPVLFIGDGVEKIKTLLDCRNASFIQCCPTAASMLQPALKALESKTFENVAYFEPFYLKEFIATVSKKTII